MPSPSAISRLTRYSRAKHLTGLRCLSLCCVWLLGLAACAKQTQQTPEDGGTRAGRGGSSSLVNCVGPTCPCADAGVEMSLCGSECVSFRSDETHCGGCDSSCVTGQSCELGVCTCPIGQGLCDGACIDISTDAVNCGACGKLCDDTQLCQAGRCITNTTGCLPACSGGQQCEQGQCLCPEGQMSCDSRCVDTRSDAEHCGSCATACKSNQTCQSGQCACKNGTTSCGGACSDLQTDSLNCGGCGHACTGAEACTDGACKLLWVDGCSDVAAHELQLRELALYQSIKIPLYAQTGPIAATDRVSDVVQGRTAAFRVFYDLTSKFKARELGVRLTIKNPLTIDRFSIKQRVEKSSTEADAQTTFMLAVPGDLLSVATSYSVQVVECAATSGDTFDTRFPETGETALQARKTGVLKVTIIPVQTNNHLPDTTPATLDKFRQYLEAMYPIERAELSVGKQIKTDYPLNWNTLVEQIRSQRAADAPADDVYYYGMVQPTDTLREYCQMGCTAGVGYVTPIEAVDARAAVGLTYGGDDTSASTMAHEIGHNHGRQHAQCPEGIAGADANFQGAKIGDWGYDTRKGKFFDPDKTQDIMGYCEPKWVSGYNYRALLERVAQVNDPNGIVVSDITPFAAFRVLIVDEDGPRWSLPYQEPVAAYGSEEQAEVLDIDGQVIEQITVYRSELPETGASTILVPQPEPGWIALRVAGAPALAFAAPVTVPPTM